MGTNNAGELLKGAKKVPKGTLFFIGHNGQLYMRSGPYLEGDGKFKFGSDRGATANPRSCRPRLVRACALGRVIQYSRGRCALNREAAAYWMPRSSRGDSGGCGSEA